MTDVLTVVRDAEKSRPLTKRFVRDQVTNKAAPQPTKFPTFYSVEQIPIDGIFSLAETLQRIAQEGKAAIIRDEPKAGINWRYTKKSSKTFTPVPRRWIAIEFDSLIPPDHIDPLHWDDAVEYCLAQLPPELERASCWAAFTSSAGIEPGIRMQLLFWLDRSLEKAEIVSWLENASSDLTQYDVVKMRFIAPPILGRGLSDPIIKRSGLWLGEDDTVAVPAIQPATGRRGSHRGAGESPREGATGLATVHGYENFKAKIAPGARHRNTLSAICSYVAVHGAKGTDRLALKRDLLAATFKAYEAPDKAEVDAWSREIDAQIDWAIEREEEKDKTAADKDLAPHFPHPTMTITKAQGVMAQAIRSVFEDGARQGLRAPAGSGKSQMVIDAIRDKKARYLELVRDTKYSHPKQPTWYFVPTIALARDLADRLSKDAPDVDAQVIRGRTAGLGEGKEADGPPPCKKAELAAELSANSIAVKPSLCERWVEVDGERRLETCEHRQTCQYFRQFNGGADVYIMAHQYLFTGRNDANGVLGDLPEPDAIVIDEAFLDAAIGKTWVTFDDWMRPREGKAMVAADIIRNTMVNGLDTLAELRKAGFTADDLRDFGDADNAAATTAEITPGMPLQRQSEAVKGLPRRGGERASAATWRLLAEELEAGLDKPRRIRLEVRKDAAGIAISWRRKPKIKNIDTVPMLLIDADLEPGLVAPFFSAVEHTSVEIERAAHVVQVVDMTGSKSQVFRDGDGPGEVFDDIVAVIEAEAYQRTVLVAGTKAIIEKLRDHPWLKTIPSERLDFVHFGALRGIDRWKDRESIVLVGREQPPSAAIEDIAAALFWDDVEPIDRIDGGLPVTVRGIRGHGAGAVPIATPVHPDHRVQLVLEQTRERQSAQAIDRLRLIHSDNVKRVVVMSNMVLDLTVDEVTTRRELAPDKGGRVIMRHGVLPLSKTDLHRLAPDLFPSVDSAKWWLREHNVSNGVDRYIELYIGIHPITLTEVEYRREGSTRTAQALVAAVGSTAIKEILTASIGMLAELGCDRTDPESSSGYEPDERAPVQNVSAGPLWKSPENAIAGRCPPDLSQLTMASTDPPWPTVYPDRVLSPPAVERGRGFGEGGFGEGPWGG